MTVIEAAKQIGVSPSKLYQLVSGRKISHYRVDGKIIVHDDDIASFLARCRVATAPVQIAVPTPQLKLKHIKLNGS